MFCNRCGAQLPDGAKFCTVCGAALAAAPTVPQQPPQPEPSQQPSQPVRPQQGAMDPERYQQLLAEKARRDAEAAAAQAQQPDPGYAQPYQSRSQPAPQQPTYQGAVPPFGAYATGQGAQQFDPSRYGQGAQQYDPSRYGQPAAPYAPVGGEAAPQLPAKKKKRALPFILAGVAVLAAAGVAVGVFWDQISDLFSGGESSKSSRRNSGKEEVSATVPDTPETVPPAPTEPTETDPVSPEPTDLYPELYFSTDYAGTYDVTLWVPPELVDLTVEQINAFNESNGAGIVINPTVESRTLDEIPDELLYGDERPDLFCFAQDQTELLYRANALSFLYRDESVEGAVNPGDEEAVRFGSYYYAYPLGTSNGYFLYYDKSVVSDADAGTLESIISDCEGAGKKFAFELEGSAWYLSSFFFGAGCHSAWELGEDGSIVGVDDSFCSDQGLVALKGMKKLLDSPCYVSSSYASELNNGAAALVSGIWTYEEAKAILGENLGVAELPRFTVDGTSYHLGSFSGGIYLGVNNGSYVSDRVLHYLGEYLSTGWANVQRYETTGLLPANLAAQAATAAGADPATAALMAQNRYAVPQGFIHGSWWDIARYLANDAKAAGTDAELYAALEQYDDYIHALFEELPAEGDGGWSAIGSFAGTFWDTDFPMYEYEDGFFITYDEFYFEAGDEFKVRFNESWELNYGADGQNGTNYVVDSAGYYYIGLDLNEGTIDLYYFTDD